MASALLGSSPTRGKRGAFLRHQPSVQLTSTDVIDFQRLLRAHTTPQAKSVRAHILLSAHAHPEWSTQAIALSLGVSDRLVRKWRRRWEETRSLNDLPRSGAPRQFEASVRALVTALACGLPRSSGVPIAHWSRAELARHLATTSSLPAISASTIGRWLKAEQIRPWRFHSRASYPGSQGIPASGTSGAPPLRTGSVLVASGDLGGLRG